MTAKAEKKQKTHLFQKGQSGNPKGRPAGSRNKATILLDKMLQGQAEGLMQKAIESALEGDGQMLRALIDKLLPNPKDRPVSVSLPAMKKTADLPKLTASLLSAIAAGKLTPIEAAGIAKAIDIHRGAVELADLESRLSAIEEKLTK